MSEMIKVTRKEIDTMLMHAVRSQDFMEIAAAKLSHEDFDQTTECGPRVIWYCAHKFYTQYKQMPTDTLLAELITAESVSIPQLQDHSILASVWGLLHSLYTRSERDLINPYAVKILESFLFERRILSPLAQAVEQQNLTDVRLREVVDQASSLKISANPVVEPFALDYIFNGATPRKLTGVAFIDGMLMGGVRPRELYGFMAPSGGGKTTMSNQLAISVAAQKRHMFVFSYEESITDDYLTPVYAHAAHISRDRMNLVKNNDFSVLTRDEQERLRVAREKIGPYLHFVDMSGEAINSTGSGGVADIEARLREYISRGIQPEGFILDWFWIMVMRYQPPQMLNDKKKNREDRLVAQTLIDQLKMLVTKYGMWGWINQQTAPAAVGKHKPKQQDAAEMKSFSWYFNNCFALGPLDEANSIGELHLAKARGQKVTSQFVQLDGEFATFKSRSEDMAYDPRQKAYVKVGEAGKVPVDPNPSKSKNQSDYGAVSPVNL